MQRDSARGGEAVMTSSEEQMTNGGNKCNTVSGVWCRQVCRSSGDHWTERGVLLADVHRRMVREFSGKLHHIRSEFVSYFTMKTGSAAETSHDEPELTNVPKYFTLLKTKINLNYLVCTYSPCRL
jgi:hypothetical protein